MDQSPQFNPNSYDSVLSNILTKLENQDKRFEVKVEEDRAAFKEMMLKQDKTNGQVQKNTLWISGFKGKVAVLSGGVVAGSAVLGFVFEHWDKVVKLFS